MDLSQGQKLDQGKPTTALIVPIYILDTARVLDFGAQKYDSWNWSKGLLYSRVLSAMTRHLLAIQSGEDRDQETGLLHTAHISCNAMFLHWFLSNPKQYEQFDDRYKIQDEY